MHQSLSKTSNLLKKPQVPLCPLNLNHLNNFDFVRFSLAILVVFSHSYYAFYGWEVPYIEPMWIISGNQIAFGTIAVNFFFVISGYLVLQSLLRSKNYLDYLLKRILRIYPGFIVTIIICAFIVGPLGNGSPQNPFQNFREYWSDISLSVLIKACIRLRGNLAFLPPTFQNNPAKGALNGSIWTIPHEFICYLILIGLAILGTFRSKKFIPLALFLVVLFFNILHFTVYADYNENGVLDAIAIPYFPASNFENWLNAEHLILFFLSGVCFYYYRSYIPRSKRLLFLSIAVMVIVTLWIKIFHLAQSIFGAYILFYFVFNSKIKISNFAKYGDFSYGIYLFGYPIQQLLMVYFGKNIGFPGCFYAAVLILLPIAFLSWHLVEKPALKLKNRRKLSPL